MPGPEAIIRHMSEALEALGVEHALVGGMAVSTRAEPRFTRDVDYAVDVDDDAAAEALVRSLRAAGYSAFELVEQEAIGRISTVRLRTRDGDVCDLLFASCGVEGAIVASATAAEVVPGLVVPVASAEGLAAMKVLSSEPSRPHDTADFLALLERGLDLEEVRSLLEAITRAGCHREQDLEAKLEVMLALRR